MKKTAWYLPMMLISVFGCGTRSTSVRYSNCDPPYRNEFVAIRGTNSDVVVIEQLVDGCPRKRTIVRHRDCR